ncbi:hypothetical protein [Telluribacter humicola]|uniref:hypothetical protein n=1 Tax=Telluribacter humicola TaxID=1720261 RepID=UPI001A96EA86|nr:hypothetical protein [Telluribacter humicola]
MLKSCLRLLIILVFSVSMVSCEVIGGIFEAGVWAGVILVALVIGVILWVVKAILGRR